MKRIAFILLTLCTVGITYAQPVPVYRRDSTKIFATPAQMDSSIEAIHFPSVQYYYLQGNTSDVTGDSALNATPYATKTTYSFTGLNTGTSLLQSWITSPGATGLTYFPAGVYTLHLHGFQASGAKTIKLYGEFWEYDSSGASVGEIGQTESTAILTTSETEYTISFASDTVWTFKNSYSRILLKVYAVIGSGSGTVNITLYAGGKADSHIELPTQVVLANYATNAALAGETVRALAAEGTKASLIDTSKIAVADSAYNVTSDTAKITIKHVGGGVIKSWFILAPPEAQLTISVDKQVRYTGLFGDLFMSRASKLPNATIDNTFDARYFSVTYSGNTSNTYGHVAYFPIAFQDSVNVTIAYNTSWRTYYYIFYENQRNSNDLYPEFYAYSQDSVLADVSVNDTLLNLSNVGAGRYWSYYMWLVSDSTIPNNHDYLTRPFCIIQDGNPTTLSLGSEDYPGYYYYYASTNISAVRNSDYHGFPTIGLRSDNKYLEAFYRIHELDPIRFNNNFILYWSWTNVSSNKSRYCHIGYCAIYYLRSPKP